MRWYLCFSGIMRLDARARQDVAILGSGFLKLDGKFYDYLIVQVNILRDLLHIGRVCCRKTLYLR